MIDKIGRGWDAPHLISYLMGPGRANEHTNPTVIAAWHNDPGALQPGKIGAGDFDFDPAGLAALREHVQAPAAAAGLPTRQPGEGEPFYTKHGYVWHASIAISAEDVAAHGPLSQETWAQIARDVMDRTGIAAADDPGGCRWVAVHHGLSEAGNDHIHIAAVLVRQDTGRRLHPRNDFHAVRSVMREWEDRLGLTTTAQNDRSAAREATRGEHEKTQRRRASGMPAATRTDPAETIRGQLRQAVADTAAVAGDGEAFLAGLRERGLLVHLHHDRDGAIDGYAVALRGDVSAETEAPIFYGGSKLSRDLSWPKLSAEWQRHGGTVAERPAKVTIDLTAGAFDRARAAVQRAHTALAHAEHPAHGRDIAVAAHRMITAYSRVTDGTAPPANAPRTQAVWSSHRSATAARTARPSPASAPVNPAADALNAAARDLLALRIVTEKGSASAASVELAVALAQLMVEVAAWHQQRGELHAATAARTTGSRLTPVSRSAAPAATTTPRPTPQRTTTAVRPRTERGHPEPPRPRRLPSAGDQSPKKGPRL
ncbi:relaxase/mobilization nuclease domain-containing protein (plasmid) [Gordonia hongkongensis]|uniref:relaxase/mobilization nuclease domain-containing protein n=1 Tax=Gordonia TaxID=2053 RepID=UPI0030CA9782